MGQILVKDGNGNFATAALVGNTGQTTKVNSFPVTVASDDQLQTNAATTTAQGATLTSQISSLNTEAAAIFAQTTQQTNKLSSMSSTLVDIDLVINQNQTTLTNIDNDIITGLKDGNSNPFLQFVTAQGATLTGQLSALNTAQIANLTQTSQLATLTSQISSLNTAQTANFTQTTQLATLTSQLSSLNTAQIGQLTQTNQLATLTSQIANLVTQGINPANISQIGGVTLVGDGTAAASEVPILIAGRDKGSVIRAWQIDRDATGLVKGAGELVCDLQFASGSATLNEGTVSRTFTIPPEDLYFNIHFDSIGGSAAPIVSGSYDGVNYFALPMAQNALSSSFPFITIGAVSVGNTYYGRTYGVQFLRVHNPTPAGSAKATLRIYPSSSSVGMISAFQFSAANTTEAVGTSSGAAGYMTGGVRTLANTYQNNGEGYLDIQQMASGGVVAVYGSLDGSTWVQIADLMPVFGSSSAGSYVAVSSVSAAGVYRFPLGSYRYVQVKQTSFTSGNTLGCIALRSRSKSDVAVSLTTNGPVTFTSTTAATILTANGYRKGLTIANEGAGDLYLLTHSSGTVNTTTNYNLKVPAAQQISLTDYVGDLRGIFASAGTARIGELI